MPAENPPRRCSWYRAQDACGFGSFPALPPPDAGHTCSTSTRMSWALVRGLWPPGRVWAGQGSRSWPYMAPAPARQALYVPICSRSGSNPDPWGLVPGRFLTTPPPPSGYPRVQRRQLVLGQGQGSGRWVPGSPLVLGVMAGGLWETVSPPGHQCDAPQFLPAPKAGVKPFPLGSGGAYAFL